MRDPLSRIYLDHNASAPLHDAARAAVCAAMEITGNPSSVHAEGRRARAVLEEARRCVAALLGAEADAVVFTSGASEAASTCLVPEWHGADRGERRFHRLAVLASDHACLRCGGRFAAVDVDELPVDARGVADAEALESWLGRWGEGGLLAFAGANNETGVVQPVREIVARARDAGAAVVLDAVQMPGRVGLDGLAGGVAATILSGHKIGAPTGVGAFVLGDVAMRPRPLVTGATQETRQRAGTPALWAIAGFGAAAREQAPRDHGALAALRDGLERRLVALCGELVVLGAGAPRLPQTLAVQVPGMAAATAQMRLDLDGFAVSAGSACASGKLLGSPVLAAMIRGGLAADEEAGLLRISFGTQTRREDLDRFADAFARLVGRKPAEQAA